MDLTEANLFHVLLDPQRRAALRGALRGEQGTVLPLTHRYFDLAYTADDAPSLGRAVLALLAERADEDGRLLEPLLSNPATPHDALNEACRQGRGMTALGHRRGPRGLLEVLAETHGSSEAITSLALFHYANEDDAFFRAFVERHRGDALLRATLVRSPLVPDHRRALVADLVGDG